MMDNTFTFTVILTREELRNNGPSVVGMSFYNLGAAVFEWGGERNKDENGKPAARIHGHHAAQRVAQHAVAEWMGWSNPLADDLTLANDRIHEMSLVNADLRARLLPALDAAGVRYDDPPEALRLWVERQEEALDRQASDIARLSADRDAYVRDLEAELALARRPWWVKLWVWVTGGGGK